MPAFKEIESKEGRRKGRFAEAWACIKIVECE